MLPVYIDTRIEKKRPRTTLQTLCPTIGALATTGRASCASSRKPAVSRQTVASRAVQPLHERERDRVYFVVEPHDELVFSVLGDLDVAEVKLAVVVRADDQHVARHVETAVRQFFEVMRLGVRAAIAHPEDVAADLALTAASVLQQRTSSASRS